MSAIRSAFASRRATSIPISAAGTIPNGESAEYRPPIVGSPANTARNPRSRARSSSAEPGSVIAAKRDGSFSRCQTS